jgi:hypothetical protein
MDENWVKLSIHNSKVKELLVEGAYGFNGSIYNIPPKEVVKMIAFMGIMYACNKYFVGLVFLHFKVM